MPNWKKVITSGSNAHINHITASGNISSSNGTGSFGRVEASTLEGTLVTAAQGNITSLGTLTTLTVDDITINGSQISDGGNLTIISTGGDVIIGSDEKQIDLRDGDDNTRFSFKTDSTPEMDVTGNFKLDGTGTIELESTGDTTIDASGDIVLDAAGDQIYFKDNGSTRFTFNVDGTPELDVTGDFIIDGSGDIKLDSATNNINLVGNITASGNISSSGDITSNTLNVNTSGELTGSYGTLHGAFNINYGSDATSTGSLANGEGYGEIFSHTPLNANVIKGNVVFHTGADWQNADADAESLGGNSMLGVALAAGGGVPGPVLIRGMVRLVAGHIDDTSGDEGDAVYLSTTTGHVQFAQPSGTGDIVRIVGYCINEADDIIYFNPSSTFVEVA